MPLPSLEKVTPIFDITIPSTGEIIKFRPFLVKEEKLLLIALESDEKNMEDAVAQIIAACVISPLKIDTLATFDLQYIFLQLRCKSVNEFSDLTYKCNRKTVLTEAEIEKRKQNNPAFARSLKTHPEGEPVVATCDNLVKFKLDLRTIQVQNNPDHTKTIYLTDKLGLTMKYPTVAVSRMLNQNKKDDQESAITNTIKMMAMCVESVFDEAAMVTGFTIKEMTDWIEHLTQPQFIKLQDFFETMPKLAHDLDFVCPVCGYQEVVHLEGLTSFFA